MGIPFAFQNFCRFSETIYDSLSALPCPLGPNVNRWVALKASTEPTFPVFMTCVGAVFRMGIPLASPISWGFFETIHDPLSALPCPLRPNVNRYATLKTSTETTFPVFMTCVGPVARMGTCPTSLKIALKALGLLGCVLKRLKILMKSDSAGPVGQNGAKFWSAPFPQIWTPWVGDLPYMLRNCGRGTRFIRLCVEKT